MSLVTHVTEDERLAEQLERDPDYAECLKSLERDFKQAENKATPLFRGRKDGKRGGRFEFLIFADGRGRANNRSHLARDVEQHSDTHKIICKIIGQMARQYHAASAQLVFDRNAEVGQPSNMGCKLVITY
jgi:hypothetical protein